MNTPRTQAAKAGGIVTISHLCGQLETELTEMRQAMSQVATNLGNCSFATVDASHEWMTKEVPEEVRLYCERLRRELAAMTKERDYQTDLCRIIKQERENFSEMMHAEREKVAKLREVANHSPSCQFTLAPWKLTCSCGL